MAGVIFLGPSRPPDLVVPPGIELRPAACRGDLAALSPAVRAVGLVDGVLHQAAAPSPEEVERLARRIPVFGGGSLGALRALDCPSVVGVGEVFAAFQDGTLEDEDEVAGTFDPTTSRPVALPLVVIREALVQAGVAPSLGRIRRLPFHERTEAAVLHRVPGAAGEAVRAALRRTPNIKQRDARAVLERLVAVLP